MEYSNKDIFCKEKHKKALKERERFIFFPTLLSFLEFRELIASPLNEKLAFCYLDLAVFFSTNSSEEDEIKILELKELLAFSKDPLYIYLVKNVINELAEKLLFSFLSKIEYLAASPFKKIEAYNLFFMKSSLELDRIIVQKEEKIGAEERFEIVLEKDESKFIISNVIFFAKDINPPTEDCLIALNKCISFLLEQKYIISSKLIEKIFKTNSSIKYCYTRVEGSIIKEIVFTHLKSSNKKFNYVERNGNFSLVGNLANKCNVSNKKYTIHSSLLALDKVINIIIQPKDKELLLSSFIWLSFYFLICLSLSSIMIMKSALILEMIAKFALGAITFVPAILMPLVLLLFFSSYKLSIKKSYSSSRFFLYKISSFYLFASFFISSLIIQKGFYCAAKTLPVRNQEAFIYFNDDYYLVDTEEKRMDFFLGKKSFQFSYAPLSYEEAKEHVHNNCINYFQVSAIPLDNKHYYCEGLNHDLFLFKSNGENIFNEIDRLYDKEKTREMLRRTMWTN